MFWGFCEVLDLVSEYKKHINSTPSKLNILLYGNGDTRHILKAMARNFEHKVELNFYVLDACIEMLARNMVLIGIALEPAELFTVKSKTHLFMDIYGNTLIRPFSYNYLASKAEIFSKIVTDPDYNENIAPFVILDGLKYRERDGLEQTFRFWTSDKRHVFHINEYWEARLRKTLGARYDHREGAFDWDLQMKLKDRGAKQVCSQEYRHWRETGVAFTFPEYEQSKPNKTFVAGLHALGREFKHRGYVGDVMIGPYCAFGLTCPDKRMLKTNHGVNDYRATDVTERNVYEIMFEIQNQVNYGSDEDVAHKLGPSVIDLSKSVPSTSTEKVDLKKYDLPFIKTENIRIHFLSIEDIIMIFEKSVFKEFFDIIFVSNTYFHLLNDNFSEVLKENCLVFFETNLLSVVEKDGIPKFLQKVKDFSNKMKLKPVTNFNLNVDHSVVKYKRINT